MMSMRQGTGNRVAKPEREPEANRCQAEPRRRKTGLVRALGAAGLLVLLAGCHNDMWIQPRVKPYDSSDFFPNGQGLRQLPAHTVDQTHYWSDTERYLGYTGGHWVNGSYVGGKLVTTFPIKITKEDILRGQDRFTIYCSPCHGALGNGQGMIAQRGLTLRRQPGDYQTDRLIKMPIGHFYDVITNGYGVMYSYAARVEPDDRWRIAAYIRVLQRSQHARPSDIPADLDAKTRATLDAAPGPASTPQSGTSQPGASSNEGAVAPPSETTPAGATGTTGANPSGETGTPNGNGTNANGH
jgi:mono/diheme cytochrome c family protein